MRMCMRMRMCISEGPKPDEDERSVYLDAAYSALAISRSGAYYAAYNRKRKRVSFPLRQCCRLSDSTSSRQYVLH